MIEMGFRSIERIISFCKELYLRYLPLYFQNVKGLSPPTSAIAFLFLVIPQSVASVVAGLYMSKYSSYGEVIWYGFGI